MEIYSLSVTISGQAAVRHYQDMRRLTFLASADFSILVKAHKTEDSNGTCHCKGLGPSGRVIRRRHGSQERPWGRLVNWSDLEFKLLECQPCVLIQKILADRNSNRI